MKIYLSHSKMLGLDQIVRVAVVDNLFILLGTLGNLGVADVASSEGAMCMKSETATESTLPVEMADIL